jgi:hypothetical protein
MKLYLVNRYGGDVRPKPASIEEIREILDGSGRDHFLANVTLGEEGLVAATLSESELKSLAANIQAEAVKQLRLALDLCLQMVKASDDIPGLMSSNEGLRFYIDSKNEWVATTIRDWAEEKHLVIADSPRPAKGKWHRYTNVKIGPKTYDRTLVSVTWSQSVSIDDDDVLAAEGVARAVASLGDGAAF